MALTSPYYLAVGSLVIEDGTDAGPYHPIGIWFPAPAPDGVGGHVPAVRRFRVKVTGTSTATLTANTAALQRACVRGETLYFRASGSGDILSCRIRDASVIEDEVDLLGALSFERYVTVTLTTDPYWLAPWGDEVDASGDITYVPGHIDIPDPGGEVDALLSMRVVPAVEGTGLFVGVMPDPSDDYEYLDDYGASGAGSADANAYGGYKVISTVDTSLSERWWVAPTISHIANEGRHIAIARVDTSAVTAGNVKVAARVTTAGADISASTTVDYQEVPLAVRSLAGVELGVVQIPAGRVMALGESSYSVAHSEAQVNDMGTRTFLSRTPVADGFDLVLSQTFPWPDGHISTCTYGIDVAPAAGTDLTIMLWRKNVFGDFVEYGIVYDCPVSVGEHTVTFQKMWGGGENIPVTAGTYVLRFEFDGSSAFSVGMPAANGVYADGELTQTVGSGLVAGDDLVFSVDGDTVDSDSTTMPLLAACSELSKVVNLDYVQRIPADFACIAYRLDSSGPLGIYYDAGTDTPYVADTDGIGPSVYEDCTINKPLRLKPGVTNRVVFGVLQGDVAVDGMSALAYHIRKRYLTATG